MENGPKREELVSRMNSLLAEDVPHILLMHRSLFSLTQSWSPRVQSNPMLEGGLKYAVLDPRSREELQKQWNRKPVWPIGLLLLIFAAASVAGIRAYRSN